MTTQPVPQPPAMPDPATVAGLEVPADFADVAVPDVTTEPDDDSDDDLTPVDGTPDDGAPTPQA